MAKHFVAPEQAEQERRSILPSLSDVAPYLVGTFSSCTARITNDLSEAFHHIYFSNDGKGCRWCMRNMDLKLSLLKESHDH